MEPLKARLHPLRVGGRAGYVYSVIYDGKLLVERSSDPECDAARALIAMGITGKLTLLDGKTGKPRTIINIEKAARLRCREGRCAPYLLPGQGGFPKGDVAGSATKQVAGVSPPRSNR